MAKQAQQLAFVDRAAVVEYLNQRLADAKKAAKGFRLAVEHEMTVGRIGKANGHAKRAAYWEAVASGIRWLLKTLPRDA